MARIKNTATPNTGHIIPIHTGRGRVTRRAAAKKSADDDMSSYIGACATEYARQRSTCMAGTPRTKIINVRLSRTDGHMKALSECPRYFRPVLNKYMRRNKISRLSIITKRRDETYAAPAGWTTYLCGYCDDDNDTPVITRKLAFVNPA